eukprot:GHVS01030232.1.p1 GENE.GHVS01030232.1~~GHVS01030232.1.p1  ORF type:complete len:253 (-),score=66.95 GHVS01030232.1:77-835(-)
MNGGSPPTKLSFGIKRKPTTSATTSSNPARTIGSGDGGRVFDDGAVEPVERREQLLSISSGGMETTGGLARNRVIVCKKKLPPREDAPQRKERKEGTSEEKVKDEIRVKVERVEEEDNKQGKGGLDEQKGGVGLSRPILSEPGWGLQVKLKKENEGGGEVEVFRRELRKYPDMSRHAYDRVPVEEFGLAMLRGMGYVPEEEGGGRHWTKPYILEKRAYARAGLGADDKVLLPTEKLDNGEKDSSGKRTLKTI